MSSGKLRLLVALVAAGFAGGVRSQVCEGPCSETVGFRFEVREGYESGAESTRGYRVAGGGRAVPNMHFLVELQNTTAKLPELSVYNARSHGFALGYAPADLLDTHRLALCLVADSGRPLALDSHYPLAVGRAGDPAVCRKASGRVHVGLHQWQAIASEAGSQPYVVQIRLLPE